MIIRTPILQLQDRTLNRPTLSECKMPLRLCFGPRCNLDRRKQSWIKAYKVEIEHAGGVTVLDVEEGNTVLETALDNGLELSHDCKMGVAISASFCCIYQFDRVSVFLQVSGTVDQSAGMLDEDVRAKGYALLCVSEPRSDCKIKVIEEDEILDQVMG